MRTVESRPRRAQSGETVRRIERRWPKNPRACGAPAPPPHRAERRKQCERPRCRATCARCAPASEQIIATPASVLRAWSAKPAPTAPPKARRHLRPLPPRRCSGAPPLGRRRRGRARGQPRRAAVAAAPAAGGRGSAAAGVAARVLAAWSAVGSPTSMLDAEAPFAAGLRALRPGGGSGRRRREAAAARAAPAPERRRPPARAGGAAAAARGVNCGAPPSTPTTSPRGSRARRVAAARRAARVVCHDEAALGLVRRLASARWALGRRAHRRLPPAARRCTRGEGGDGQCTCIDSRETARLTAHSPLAHGGALFSTGCFHACARRAARRRFPSHSSVGGIALRLAEQLASESARSARPSAAPPPSGGPPRAARRRRRPPQPTRGGARVERACSARVDGGGGGGGARRRRGAPATPRARRRGGGLDELVERLDARRPQPPSRSAGSSAAAPRAPPRRR